MALRKALKWLGIVTGTLALGAGGFALYVQASDIPQYPVEPVDVVIERTPQRVAHGRELAGMLCAGCHLDPATKALTGKRMADAPPEFGAIYTPNITADSRHGIGSWTDGQLLYLLRTGIRPDGRYTPPYMPKLPRASDEDLASVIAFLRSDDPMVRPAAVPSRPSEPSFLVRLLSRVAWKPMPYPRRPIVAPSPSDRIARGRYLANDVLDCYPCHSADFKKMDPLYPERSAGFYEGGNTLLDASGREIYSANLTPDPATGIGSWTEDDFARALRGGLRPDGTLLRYPMQMYPALAEDDARAIYAYLKTLSPVARPRPASPAQTAARAASAGQRTYVERRCTSCHGERGSGLYDLRRAAAKYPTDAELIAFIKNPAARRPGIAMPAWEGVIREEEYPALAAYVRSLQLPEAAQ